MCWAEMDDLLFIALIRFIMLNSQNLTLAGHKLRVTIVLSSPERHLVCVVLVYIAWLYTGAAALHHGRDNSIVVLLKGAYRHILCVKARVLNQPKQSGFI